MNVELLRAYRIQNPVKYLQKYGDVPPEEAVKKLVPNKPFNLGGVKFELSEKKEKEIQFKDSGEPPFVVPNGEISTSDKVEIIKPKRGRKKLENVQINPIS